MTADEAEDGGASSVGTSITEAAERLAAAWMPEATAAATAAEWAAGGDETCLPLADESLALRAGAGRGGAKPAVVGTEQSQQQRKINELRRRAEAAKESVETESAVGRRIEASSRAVAQGLPRLQQRALHAPRTAKGGRAVQVDLGRRDTEPSSSRCGGGGRDSYLTLRLLLATDQCGMGEGEGEGEGGEARFRAAVAAALDAAAVAASPAAARAPSPSFSEIHAGHEGGARAGEHEAARVLDDVAPRKVLGLTVVKCVAWLASQSMRYYDLDGKRVPFPTSFSELARLSRAEAGEFPGELSVPPRLADDCSDAASDFTPPQQVGATVAAPGLALDFDEGRLDARKDHARPDGRDFRAAREKASRARHAAPQAPPLEMDAE